MVADTPVPPPHLTARAEVRSMEGYHSAQIDVPVRLNVNEAPDGPPEGFLSALAEAVRTIEWNRYPDRGVVELRAALAARHGVDPAQVFVANGSNEVLQTLLLAYGGPGRRVAVFEPTYRLHSHIAQLTGATVIEGERAGDFSLDGEVVRRTLRSADPHVTFLCSPNNPTGMIDPPEAVAEVVELASGLVVVDEAYAEFSSWSALSMVAENRPVVVSRTFSKTWGMAAARLGYLVAPSWVVAELDKVVLPYHLDALKQIAGCLALGFEAETQDRVRRIVTERERLVAALSDLAVDVWPSGANFVLFRPRAVPGRRVWEGLVEHGVLVRDCSSWPRLGGCLRVTVGTPEEDDRFLDGLSRLLDQGQGTGSGPSGS
jgi:histidinol-phosphate aminotransferase